jgi:hypothetical protein
MEIKAYTSVSIAREKDGYAKRDEVLAKYLGKGYKVDSQLLLDSSGRIIFVDTFTMEILSEED